MCKSRLGADHTVPSTNRNSVLELAYDFNPIGSSQRRWLCAEWRVYGCRKHQGLSLTVEPQALRSVISLYSMDHVAVVQLIGSTGQASSTVSYGKHRCARDIVCAAYMNKMVHHDRVSPLL